MYWTYFKLLFYWSSPRNTSILQSPWRILKHSTTFFLGEIYRTMNVLVNAFFLASAKAASIQLRLPLSTFYLLSHRSWSTSTSVSLEVLVCTSLPSKWGGGLAQPSSNGTHSESRHICFSQLFFSLFLSQTSWETLSSSLHMKIVYQYIAFKYAICYPEKRYRHTKPRLTSISHSILW